MRKLYPFSPCGRWGVTQVGFLLLLLYQCIFVKGEQYSFLKYLASVEPSIL